MRTAFTCALLALAGGVTLGTDYTKERAVKVDSEFSLSREVTEMTMERDGEPVDMPDRGNGKTEQNWHIVQVDTVQERDGKKPSKVKRHYEKVGGEFDMGDNQVELSSPFDATTLELTADGDDVKVEVVEGAKPDHDGALEGHKLGLALDALLPGKEVEKDASWDLDKQQINHALGLDLRKALYPPQQREDTSGGDSGGGGRRRGGFGRGGGMGGIPADADWTGKAHLVSLDEDVDGVKCAKIEIEISAHGDLPEPQMGGGRGRGRMLEPESALPLLASTYSIEAKGEFTFAIEGKRPVKLELEGTMETVTDREMTRQESTMKIHSKTQGKLKLKVDVSEQALEKEAK
ncbi:MAG: hypothetical protein IPJ19_16705 [Planctomycetes bacterium]|nr:hypothetical protein [Planctomycetota bacterium]